MADTKADIGDVVPPPTEMAEESQQGSSSRMPPADGLYYKLISKDDQEFYISPEAIKQSVTLSTLITDLGCTMEDTHTHPIPCKQCDATTLDLIIKWCEHHQGEPIPPETEPVAVTTIPEWDQNLLNIDHEDLFNLICAVNSLEIRVLLNYACKKVADLGRGKNMDEIRVIYGIPTDEEDEAAQETGERSYEERERLERETLEEYRKQMSGR